MLRRVLVFLLLAAILAGAIAVGLQMSAVQDRVVDVAIERMATSRPDELFDDDALRVLMCGTSSPLPHATRARSCVAVFAAGRFWVVDTGNGSWNQLALRRVDGSRIAGVLLTHFHSDHIGDLGEFQLNTWVLGRDAPLRVLGPPGVERVVAGFKEAYGLDGAYRTLHHGSELLSPEVGYAVARAIPGPAAGGGPAVVSDEDGLRITAFAVDHAPVRPAYGYRFDYRGRSLVVSGDTVKTAGLLDAARDVDVLVHEAQANHLVARIGAVAAGTGQPRVAKIMGDIPDYHTTPVEAAELANEAGVELLVLYHLTPPPPMSLVEAVYTRGVDDVRPEGWVLAEEGLLITLPADGSEIELGEL